MNKWIRVFLLKISWLYTQLLIVRGLKWWHTYFELRQYPNGGILAIRKYGVTDEELDHSLHKAGFEWSDAVNYT